MTPDLGPLTTASIYAQHLAWLKQRQLRASGEYARILERYSPLMVEEKR